MYAKGSHKNLLDGVDSGGATKEVGGGKRKEEEEKNRLGPVMVSDTLCRTAGRRVLLTRTSPGLSFFYTKFKAGQQR